jgi:CheY-like chemotaxis protein
MNTVLIVDDTLDCSEPLAKLLRKRGHTVECAPDGAEALALLARFRPDVIVLDLMMPVMDGVSFLEVLRGDPERKDIRVVVLSGCGDGLPAGRLAELGVGEIFLKGSVDFCRLLEVLAWR